jgi:hypothetical protein
MDASDNTKKALIPVELLNLIIFHMDLRDRISFYHAFSFKCCPCRLCCKKSRIPRIQTLETLERQMDVMFDILESVKDFRDYNPK